MLQFGVGTSSKGPGLENVVPHLGLEWEVVKKLKRWAFEEMAVSSFFISWRLWGEDVSALHAPTMTCCLATGPKAIGPLTIAFQTLPKQTFLVFKVLILRVIVQARKAEQHACARMFYSFHICHWGKRKPLEVLVSVTASRACTKLDTSFFCLFSEGLGGMVSIMYCNKKDTKFL